MESLWKVHFYLGGTPMNQARRTRAVKRRKIPERCVEIVKILKHGNARKRIITVRYRAAKREADNIRHYLFRRVFERLSEADYDIVLACTLDSKVMHRHSEEWRSVHGFVDVENNRVFVDPRTDLLATLLHEMLHVVYEEAEEEVVRDMEWLMVSGMNPCRAKRLIAFLHVHAK